MRHEFTRRLHCAISSAAVEYLAPNVQCDSAFGIWLAQGHFRAQWYDQLRASGRSHGATEG